MDCGKRCELCNIPHNFPRVFFDKRNICSLCKQYKKDSLYYKGTAELKRKIHKILLKNPERKYDCAVGFSGGKDSSYLLYFAKNVLGLNVLAVTFTNDFIPEETRDNIDNIPKILNVDSVKITNKDLNYCSRKNVRAWAKKPSPQMLLTFCSGCRYGLKKLLPDYVKKHHIPILLVGDMRVEKISYRTDILALNPNKPTFLSKLLGYLKQLIINPYFLLSPKCLIMNLKEFLWCSRNDKRSRSPVIIKPFFDYVEVKEENVTEILKELGWKFDSSFNTSTRADCYINILRQYYYRKMLGYNDVDVRCMDLIQRNKMTKQAGLQQIKKDCYSYDLLDELLKGYYDLSFYDIDNLIKTFKK